MTFFVFPNSILGLSANTNPPLPPLISTLYSFLIGGFGKLFPPSNIPSVEAVSDIFRSSGVITSRFGQSLNISLKSSTFGSPLSGKFTSSNFVHP